MTIPRSYSKCRSKILDHYRWYRSTNDMAIASPSETRSFVADLECNNHVTQAACPLSAKRGNSGRHPKTEGTATNG